MIVWRNNPGITIEIIQEWFPSLVPYCRTTFLSFGGLWTRVKANHWVSRLWGSDFESVLKIKEAKSSTLFPRRDRVWVYTFGGNVGKPPDLWSQGACATKAVVHGTARKTPPVWDPESLKKNLTDPKIQKSIMRTFKNNQVISSRLIRAREWFLWFRTDV